MNERARKDRLGNDVLEVGENLSPGRREQMEKKEQSKHEDGKEREQLIEEAQELEGQ